MRFKVFLCMSFFACFFQGYGKNKSKASPVFLRHYTDSLSADSAVRAINVSGKKSSLGDSLQNVLNSVKPAQFDYFPGVSLQQYLKGQAAGVYIQEPNGEPGTEQNIFIHGASMPILSAQDLFNSQPLVVIDGVPIISKDHPFAYDIQYYDFNRIGSATNLLAGIQPENIASIQVLTDPIEIAKYGARATNGVIYIKTKPSSGNRHISINSYFGFATPPTVTTINGASENKFRAPFYQRYATFEQTQNIPSYLSDSLYNIYYGPSNWTDLYYKKSLVYGIDANASGGNSRSNFRVSLGNQRSGGVADGTGMDRYSAAFIMNMIPLKWLNVTTSINASQIVRERNKYMRDRYAEIRYFPNLVNPPAPNKEYYGKYLREYDKSFDKNRNNLINGYLNVDITFGKFLVNSKLAVDYSEGYRDVFYPSTLMETNSYVSNYFGYNQRLLAENSISYNLTPNKQSNLSFEVGQSLQWDTYQYSYGNAYRGSSDYIKINLLTEPTGNYTPAVFTYNFVGGVGGFLNSLTYRYLDRVKNNLVSLYGKTSYSYKDKYFFSAILREDASSTAQPTSRWFFSPAVSAKWSAKKDFFTKSKVISDLDFNAGYSRLGRVQTDDKFSAGPQYTIDIGYSGEARIGSFSNTATLNRPYSTGWIGYDIPWAYSEQINAGVSIGLWNNRLTSSIQFYSKSDKDQILGIPAYAEYGYEKSLAAGLGVNNKGVDVIISGNPLNSSNKLKWTPSINLNFNKNKLLALPGGYQELSIGNKLLKVGEPIDSYWLYVNEGIYTSESQIPVNPSTGNKLSIESIQFGVGDPKWKDINGDFILDNRDKVLKGHTLPVVAGGFTNDLSFKRASLSFNFYFNLGRDIINEEMSRRFDFVNNQSVNDITSVKEVTFWEKRGDYSKYPIYNPWSSVIPYRADQDLFLENGAFVKLRAVTFGYDFIDVLKRKANKGTHLRGYVTVNNVFTLTPYSGRDPELVNYAGYDTGYGLAIPRTFTMGFKYTL